MPEFRIRPGDYIALVGNAFATARVFAAFYVEYDDGSTDILTVPDTAIGGTGVSDIRAKAHGLVTAGYIDFSGSQTGNVPAGQCYVEAHITADAADSVTARRNVLCEGNLYTGHYVPLGLFELPLPCLLSMDVTYQQANVAGGAIRVEISPGTGFDFELMYLHVVNSGTNSIQVRPEAAANSTQHQALWGAVGSAAATEHSGPIYGTVSAGTTGTAAVGYPQRAIVTGGQYLDIRQLGAGAQNDTFRILIVILSRSNGTLPTITKANSTNPANVSVSAGTAAFAVP